MVGIYFFFFIEHAPLLIVILHAWVYTEVGKGRFTVVSTRNTEFIPVLYVYIRKAGNLSTYEIVPKCNVPF